MKMSGGVLSCCVALLLALTSVSAVPKLKSINDLKKINFGKSVPKHSLMLLHWFANTVDIDSNSVIWLTFDPNRRDYGSHHYGNFEELLDPLPWGYRYYTVGNLYEVTSEQLPLHVRNPPSEYVGRNMDRIIFRVQEQNTGQEALQRIDRVYITQHYATSEHQGTSYDPDHTYLITTRLLRQIREFSVREEQRPLLYLRNRYGRNIDDFQFNDIRQTWSNLACLGLLLFIVLQEKYSSNQRHNRRPEHNDRRPEHNVRRPENNQWDINNRLKINNRPENNNTREINIRLEDDIELVNDRSENTQSRCRCRTLTICCLVVGFILVILIIFLCIYFINKH
ncbi:uncharacterized protein LOC104929805 [Larimichthys crocea]|uniref:uncharacterized protein LOC104929805 n=1 Tax=Larimichthys crocea TaxID=215358 RepID=UPI000F5E81AE|nr:uncharacterized protein LOC104929805 [Larimichthys crocea]